MIDFSRKVTKVKDIPSIIPSGMMGGWWMGLDPERTSARIHCFTP